MIVEKKALELIKELVEQVEREGTPRWAWYTIYDIACHALGSGEITERGMRWAVDKFGLEKAQNSLFP